MFDINRATNYEKTRHLLAMQRVAEGESGPDKWEPEEVDLIMTSFDDGFDAGYQYAMKLLQEGCRRS